MATMGAIELKEILVVIVHPCRYFHIFWLVTVTGPCSAIGSQSNCRSKGCEFDSGSVPYFCEDQS